MKGISYKITFERTKMNSTELQEKLNALNGKKEKLKTKSWFRAVQVIYATLAIIAEGLVLLLTFSDESDQQFSIFIWGTAIVFALFWIIRRVGYYIIIGNENIVQPDYEHTLEAKLKSYGQNK